MLPRPASLLRGFLLLLVAVAARGADTGLVIGHVWARPSPPGVSVAAVYLDLSNQGSADDRLLRITSAVASSVQLHETHDNHGMMSMRQLPFVDVPAGSTVKAAPGALHIMLLGLKKPLLNGDTFSLTLVFANAGELTVQVRVRTDR